jgi:hypothetical protein
MWQDRKDVAAIAAGTPSPPVKRPRARLSASRSAFLQSSIELAVQRVEHDLKEDEYEAWKRQPTLLEDHQLAIDPIRYWQLQASQYPQLSKLAIDVMTIPAAAADCERTFSELSDLLGTRRLHIKPELLTALQSIKSWKAIRIKPAVATSYNGPIRALTNDEIDKIPAELGQFKLR